MGLWAIDTANGNSAGTLEKCMLERSAADIILSQESKVWDDDRLASSTLAARNAGWNPIVTKAVRTSEHHGSGGNGVFARRGTGINDATPQLVKPQFRHRLCVAWVDAVCKGGIYAISVWLRHSEGLSAENMCILEELAGIIKSLKGPWVCGGDWNIGPDTLEASKLPKMVGGKIFATKLETCNDSTYDFFIVDRGIALAVAGVQRLDNGGMKPHWPSRLLIRGNGRRYCIRKLVLPPKVAGLLPFGPMAQHPDYDVVVRLASTDDTLNEGMGTWYRSVRQEFSQLAGEDLSYRQPRFKWAVATGQTAKKWTGSTSLSVMWRSLARKAEDIARTLAPGASTPSAERCKVIVEHLGSAARAPLKVCNSQREAVSPVVAHWTSSLHSAVAATSQHWLLSLRAIADVRAKIAESTTLRIRLAEWKNTVGTTTATGRRPTRTAYRWVKGVCGWEQSPLGCTSNNEGIPESPDEDADTFDEQMSFQLDTTTNAVVPLSDQASVEVERQKWEPLWQVGEEYPELEFPDDPENQHQLQALMPWAIRRAADSFPMGTGLGADNIAPRAINRLSEDAILALCALLMAFERAGSWVQVLNLVLIVLLPKAEGGLRPIGLFPTTVRLWMRTRISVARAWETVNALPSIFGGPSMGAQRASWEAAFTAELAAMQKMVHLQALYDLVKAFETVAHHILLKFAIAKGYCIPLLRLSLAAYRLRRTIGIGGTYSKVVVAVRGITAGSGFATSELRVILHDLMIELGSRWAPRLEAKLYVDDLSLAIAGAAGVVIRIMAKINRYVIWFFQDVLLMEVSAKKSATLSNKPRAAVALAGTCKDRKLSAVKRAKLLGTGVCGGSRRSTKVFRDRLNAFNKRIKRYRALRRLGANTAQMAGIADGDIWVRNNWSLRLSAWASQSVDRPRGGGASGGQEHRGALRCHRWRLWNSRSGVRGSPAASALLGHSHLGVLVHNDHV